MVIQNNAVFLRLDERRSTKWEEALVQVNFKTKYIHESEEWYQVYDETPWKGNTCKIAGNRTRSSKVIYQQNHGKEQEAK